MTDSGTESNEPEVSDLLRSPNGECAMCELNGTETVFAYTLEDYAATNLDEDVPVRYVELCSHHYELLREESRLVNQQEVPGFAE
jgi:hypothetical protein